MSSSLHTVFYIHQVHGELPRHQVLSTMRLSIVCYPLPAPITGTLRPFRVGKCLTRWCSALTATDHEYEALSKRLLISFFTLGQISSMNFIHFLFL